jgi:hypothetical protein
MDIFRTLIVASASVELAREIAASFGPAGEGMWQTALSANGVYPSTHFISTGYVPEEFVVLLPYQAWEYWDGAWKRTQKTLGNPVELYNLATAQGVVCTQADIDTLFTTSDITDQQPFVAMDRLGVKFISLEVAHA